MEAARDTLSAALEGQPADFAPAVQLMLGQALLMLDDYESGLARLGARLGHAVI